VSAKVNHILIAATAGVVSVSVLTCLSFAAAAV
jgi:hypothetical protein